MPERIKGNGVQTVVVETSNRFGRDLMVQEVGFIKRGAAVDRLVILPNPCRARRRTDPGRDCRLLGQGPRRTELRPVVQPRLVVGVTRCIFVETR